MFKMPSHDCKMKSLCFLPSEYSVPQLVKVAGPVLGTSAMCFSPIVCKCIGTSHVLACLRVHNYMVPMLQSLPQSLQVVSIKLLFAGLPQSIPASNAWSSAPLQPLLQCPDAT